MFSLIIILYFRLQKSCYCILAFFTDDEESYSSKNKGTKRISSDEEGGMRDKPMSAFTAKPVSIDPSNQIISGSADSSTPKSKPEALIEAASDASETQHQLPPATKQVASMAGSALLGAALTGSKQSPLKADGSTFSRGANALPLSVSSSIQLPLSTSISSVPQTPSSVMAAAATANAAELKAISSSVNMKPLPTSLSMHPILRASAPSSVMSRPPMSLTAIAAAAKPGIGSMQHSLNHPQRWPSHLNSLNSLADISGHRLSGPGGQPPTSTPPPPPPYSDIRHPNIPPGLSVIRKPFPGVGAQGGGAPNLTLGGAGAPGVHYLGSGPPRLQGPHEHKSSSKGSAASPKSGSNMALGPGGAPLSLPNATITSLQALTSITGLSSPPKSSANRLPSSTSTPPHTGTTTTSGSKPSHPSPYPHFPDHYSGHPSFGGYPPRMHGPHSRHPPPLHASQGGALPPGMYGSPMPPHPGYPPPHHPGVLRGPHMYRPSPPHPGHSSSPNHPAAHLMMKGGYPGMEPVPAGGYPGSPHESHSPGSPSVTEDDRDRQPPPPPPQHPNAPSKATEPGEFSSGLLSYFSSQREDDME